MSDASIPVIVELDVTSSASSRQHTPSKGSASIDMSSVHSSPFSYISGSNSRSKSKLDNSLSAEKTSNSIKRNMKDSGDGPSNKLISNAAADGIFNNKIVRSASSQLRKLRKSLDKVRRKSKQVC